jgi:PAS domain S-box-containing protein
VSTAALALSQASGSTTSLRGESPWVGESSATIAHLRRVIERQPGCLLRADLTGRLLAANDAALGLLGASECREVLGTELTTWIVPEHHDSWKQMVARIGADAAGSVECDVIDQQGTRRTILFHGVPLVDHPDGIPSMILGARDTSALHQLESSVLETSHQRYAEERVHLERLLKVGRQHLEVQRLQLADAVAERQRLEALLEQRETAHQVLVSEQEQLRRALTEQHRIDVQGREAEAQRQVDGLRAELAEVEGERQRLQALVGLCEADRAQLAEELAAARARAEEARAGVAERQTRLVQALADRGVELRYAESTALELAGLAAVGRLALALGVELRCIVEAIAIRSQHLLADCPPGAACREDAEALRGDTVRAGSLLSQLERTQVGASAALAPTSVMNAGVTACTCSEVFHDE